MMISIIVPIYNIKDCYLEECINSLINQTYNDIEIIMIDDGSNEECNLFCKQLAKIDNRIRLIRQDNHGVSYARNQGVKVSNGSYIMFVDADDWVEKTIVEKLYNSTVNSDKDISACGTKYIFDNYEEKRVWFDNDVILSKEEAYKEVLIDKKISSSPCARLFKKELITKYEFPIGRRFEDAYIMHEIIYNSNGISIVSDYLYNYRQVETSFSHLKNIKNDLDEIDTWKHRFDFVAKNTPSYLDLIRLSLIKKEINFINNYKKIENEQCAIFRDDIYNDDVEKLIKNKLSKKWIFRYLRSTKYYNSIFMNVLLKTLEKM